MSAAQDLPQVSVKQGKLRGELVRNGNGKDYCAFRGIPYAKPPVGELRFKRPEPPESWSGVRDASKEGKPSLHYDPIFQKVMGNEDCLFLNVYTPGKIDPKAKKAVMLWVHGGSYAMGSSSAAVYGGGKFMDHDVVLVTINYRLGPFGFLSTGDDSASGNYGLWDQVAALRWVQDNIRVFGGNPEQVTVFGESAGGSSVELLMMSPAAQGLFHQVISQSGFAASCLWYTSGFKRGKKLAEALKCPTDCTKKMVECLRAKSAREIIDAYIQVFLDQASSGTNMVFTPVIDNYVTPSFLPDYPINLLRSGQFSKIPVIAGFNENEGGFFHGLAKVLKGKPTTKLTPEIEFDRQLVKITGVTGLSEVVKKLYFRNGDINKEEDRNKVYEQIIGDFLFVSCQQQFLKTVAQHGVPAYMYLFSYASSQASFAKLFNPDAQGKLAPVHADDIFYLFESQLPLAEEDSETSQRLLTMWSNFAKTGNPTPETTELLPIKWRSLTPNSPQKTCLQISDNLTIVDGFRNEFADFWNVLHNRIERKFIKSEL